jgi:oxygen-independent coproporphyrinogen-3 oxidase
MHKLTQKEYYFQILMMGLRLVNGLDLSNKLYKTVYLFYKNKIDKYVTIKNNHLCAKNINLLDTILLEIV